MAFLAAKHCREDSHVISGLKQKTTMFVVVRSYKNRAYQVTLISMKAMTSCEAVKINGTLNYLTSFDHAFTFR